MTLILSILSKYIKHISIVLFVILISALSIQTIRLADEKKDHAETVAKNEKEWALQYKISADVSKELLSIYKEQTEALKEEADNAKKQRDKASADAVANTDIGARLRRELTKERNSGCASKTDNTTSTDRSEAARKTRDMLDYVQRRTDEAADTIAEFADKSSIAGTACERSYERVR